MASGHSPVRLDSYLIKSAYYTSIPMDAFEKHLENATAKGAYIVPGAVLAVVDKRPYFALATTRQVRLMRIIRNL